MLSPSAPDRKIADIQALRGISILLVLFQHLSLTATFFGKFPKPIELPFHLGVEMFFLISGYVVTLALFKDDFRGIPFLIKRVFRLVPVLLIFLVLSYAIVLWVRHQVSADSGIFSYFAPTDANFLRQAAGILGGFLILLDGAPAIYNNTAMWSLSVEDQFYAAVALLCVVGVVLQRLVRIPTRWWVLAVSAVLLIAITWMRLRILRGKEATRYYPELMHYLLSFRFDFLAAGVLLAFADRNLPDRVRTRLKEIGPFATGFLLFMPLWVTAMCESPFGDNKRFLVGLAMPCSLGCFAILILLAGNQCAFPAAKGFVYRSLVWIGNRSYTYYVFHFPLFLAAWLIMLRWRPSSFETAWRYGFAQLAISLPILIVVVELVYRYVEMPLTRFGKHLVDGRKPPTVETHANAASSIQLPRLAA